MCKKCPQSLQKSCAASVWRTAGAATTLAKYILASYGAVTVTPRAYLDNKISIDSLGHRWVGGARKSELIIWQVVEKAILMNQFMWVSQ